jgi:hypothetical protein
MDIGKPKNGNIIEFSARLGRESMPIGAKHPHKANKSKLWVTKKPRPITRYFDLFGPCKGDMTEVMDLGLQLAREALDKGDREYAERILARLKKIPMEYERERLFKRLKSMG